MDRKWNIQSLHKSIEKAIAIILFGSKPSQIGHVSNAVKRHHNLTVTRVNKFRYYLNRNWQNKTLIRMIT